MGLILLVIRQIMLGGVNEAVVRIVISNDTINNAYLAYGLQPTFSYRAAADPQIQACGAVQIYGASLVCMNDWWCSASLPFICKKCKLKFEYFPSRISIQSIILFFLAQ